MEITMNTSEYAGGIPVPCAASAAATLEVRGAAARQAAVTVTRAWDDATRGMKRAAFAPNHTQGSQSWSPPL